MKTRLVSALAAALLVNTAASATQVSLTGGKTVNLKSAGKLTDKGVLKFVKEPGLAGTLPSPLCPVPSNVHMKSDLYDVTYPLDCNAWLPWGGGYTFLDSSGVNGVQKILFRPGREAGQIKVRLGGEGYATNPLGGPVTSVEVSLVVGETVYCGRFAKPLSTFAKNNALEVLVKGPSTTCLSPPPTLAVPTGTAAATVTATPTRTATQVKLPADTATPKPTRTPTEIPTIPPTVTETPTVGPNQLNYECSRPGDKNPKVADKVAAQTLRWLRDWSTCLKRSGFAGPECEVHLGIGENSAKVLETTGQSLINELVCNEPRCTRDLGRSLAHCQKKFSYEGFCTLDDWNKVWHWVGDPPLMSTGKCSLTTGQDCVADADCGAGETCVAPSSCDVYKYAPAAWEPCRCIQEAFIEPQIDEWLAELRALDPAPTTRCAKAAFNTMGEAIGPLIDSGCLDPNDSTCTAAINGCEAQWESVVLRLQCGACPLGPDLSCPGSCPGAQIPCETWMSWCAAAKARFDPLRTGTRASVWP